MLFLTYWELNEDTPAAQQLQAAQTLMSSGLFPSKDVNILRWDVTPDNWGILLCEAESASAMAERVSENATEMATHCPLSSSSSASSTVPGARMSELFWRSLSMAARAFFGLLPRGSSSISLRNAVQACS